MATGLRSGVNATTTTTHISASDPASPSSMILITGAGGDPVDIGPITQFRAQAFSLANTASDGVPRTFAADISPSGDYVGGETWRVVLGGRTFKFTAPNNPLPGQGTPRAISQGLVDQINQGVNRTLTLSGHPAAGQVWTVTLTAGTTATPASYTVQAGDDLAAAVKGLTGAIDALLAYSATAVPGDVSSIGLEHAGAFTVAFSASSGDGSATISGSTSSPFLAALASVAGSTIHVVAAVPQSTGSLSELFELKGTPVANQAWTVTLAAGSNLTASYKVKAGDGLGDIATGLAAAIDALAGYSAVVSPNNANAIIVTHTRTVSATLAVSGGGDGAITLKYEPFTVLQSGFTRGGGSVKGVFDIDHSIPATGSFQVFSGFNFGFPIFTSVRYTITPTLEIYGPIVNGTGPLIATVTNGPGIDPGSITNDPFFTYNFGKAGDYVVKVASIQTFDDPRFSPVVLPGVATGIAYQLNVSIQRHATNPSAISLAGKTITIIAGTGKGLTGTIAAYDPGSRTYTLATPWPAAPDLNAPDSSSEFAISLDPTTEFPTFKDASPVTDTYTAVLTSQPKAGQPVTVDVSPQPTRTYNSALAFNADAGFGQDTAIQVKVATTQLAVTLTGTPVAGETWSLTLSRIKTGLGTSDNASYTRSYHRAGGRHAGHGGRPPQVRHRRPRPGLRDDRPGPGERRIRDDDHRPGRVLRRVRHHPFDAARRERGRHLPAVGPGGRRGPGLVDHAHRRHGHTGHRLLHGPGQRHDPVHPGRSRRSSSN